jgi:hypothetical protein
MKIGLAIEELHRSENELAIELLQIAERHAADHEIFHLAQDLSAWSRRHVRDLAEAGRRYGLELDPEAKDTHSLVEAAREAGSKLLSRRPEPGLLLLADLRKLYRMASGASLDWEVLGQAAQAVEDQALLGLVKECHPDTLRQARWANAHLKEAAAQTLVT